MVLAMDPQSIYRSVQDVYSLAARTSAEEYGSTVAKAFGYSEEELKNTPQDANLGLSCGNPIALASLKEVRKFWTRKRYPIALPSRITGSHCSGNQSTWSFECFCRLQLHCFYTFSFNHACLYRKTA